MRDRIGYCFSQSEHVLPLWLERFLPVHPSACHAVSIPARVPLSSFRLIFHRNKPCLPNGGNHGKLPNRHREPMRGKLRQIHTGIIRKGYPERFSRIQSWSEQSSVRIWRVKRKSGLNNYCQPSQQQLSLRSPWTAPSAHRVGQTKRADIIQILCSVKFTISA